MNTQCQCCGCTELRPSSLPNRYFALLQCANCGHIQISGNAQHAASPEEIQKVFFGDSFAARGSWAIRLFESINNVRTLRAMQVRAPARVLEVGPGSGSLMNHLHQSGYDVVGFDLSSAVADAISDRYGLNVFVGTPDQLVVAYSATPFDVIVMRHVVEHFDSPRDELKKILSVLTGGGELLVAVPNADSWHASFSGWSGYEPYHFQFFGAKSLQRLLTSLGLTIRNVSTYESITGWPNTILRSVARKASPQALAPSQPRKNGRSARTILEVVRLAIGLALSPVRWLQSRLGGGEELIVDARRGTDK